MHKGNPTGDRWTAEHCCDLTAKQVASLLMSVERHVDYDRKIVAGKLRQASRDSLDAAAAFDDKRESGSLETSYMAGVVVLTERAQRGTFLINEMRRFIEYHIKESE